MWTWPSRGSWRGPWLWRWRTWRLVDGLHAAVDFCWTGKKRDMNSLEDLLGCCRHYSGHSTPCPSSCPWPGLVVNSLASPARLGLGYEGCETSTKVLPGDLKSWRIDLPARKLWPSHFLFSGSPRNPQLMTRTESSHFVIKWNGWQVKPQLYLQSDFSFSLLYSLQKLSVWQLVAKLLFIMVITVLVIVQGSH